jgi:hypothetical protein
MSQPGYPPREQSSSTTIWIIVLVLVLVIGLPILLAAVMFLGCCGLMESAPPAFQMTGRWPSSSMPRDPVMQSTSARFRTSAKLHRYVGGQQKQTTVGTNVIVFDVSGSKGSGQLIAEQQPGPQPPGSPVKIFSKARLRTSQGEFPLSQ